MQKRNFPDFIDAYLHFTAGHEGTERCHLWSILSVLAASIERKVWLDRGYYTLFPNLYVFIIGRSGLIKKSTTTGIAVDLFRSLPDAKMMSERLTSASLIEQLHKAHSTFEYENQQIKQSALFAYASELAVFMEEVQGNISLLLTDFFDCRPNDSEKPWIHATKTTGTQKIYGPCLNMLGASTKAWLKKSIPSADMEGGFSSRVVFVVENSLPKNLVAWPELSAGDRMAKEKLIDDLCAIHSLVGKMRVTKDAKEFFTEWYKLHMTMVVPEESDPRMSGYLGRKGDLLLKVGMLRSVSLRNDLYIDKEDLYWAGRHLETIEKDMRASFETLGASDAGLITFDVKAFIAGRQGWVDKTEVKRAFARQAPGHEVERVLEDLVEMDEIEIREERTTEHTRYYYKARGMRATL